MFGCLVAAVLLGRLIRRLLPEHHLASESKDGIKLALGLVSTMSALVLGLLVSSAKSSYDAERGEVIQMAAKVSFADRVLAMYGPDADDLRIRFHEGVRDAIKGLWPEEAGLRASLAPNTQTGNALYVGVQNLSPRDETQRKLKDEAVSLATDLVQLRSLLHAQSVPSISKPMLIILVSWLVITFLGFSVLAPSNPTVIFAFIISAIAVSGAIFLILELDEPFGGVLQISSEPMVHALDQIAK